MIIVSQSIHQHAYRIVASGEGSVGVFTEVLVAWRVEQVDPTAQIVEAQNLRKKIEKKRRALEVYITKKWKVKSAGNPKLEVPII